MNQLIKTTCGDMRLLMPAICRCCLLQSVIGLAAFWVVLGGIVGVGGFNYVNSKQIKDQP
jgi:hypothetical protein